jgi:hypothetical protein
MLSERRDILRGRDQVSLETDMEWTQSCTWRLRSIEFRDALGGRDRLNIGMHFESLISQVWRCTGGP